jgi:hypothetical protein
MVANLALAPFFLIRDSQSSRTWSSRTIASATNSFFNKDGSPVDNGRRTQHQLRWIDFNAYEKAEPDHVAAVLDDFYKLRRLGFVYQPWVEFSEPPFNGNLVNIDRDERGFPMRRTVNPLNDRGLSTVRIFTLGGSTTFGYNVSDEETWPSFLSKILNERARVKELGIHIEVVNYGRGFYNTSQETILLIDLMKSGHRPNAVILMDGVNWPYYEDTSAFTDTLERRFRNIQFGSDVAFWDQFTWVPIVRLAQGINRRLSPRPTTDNTKRKVSEPPYHLIVNRFDQNMRLIIQTCDTYSVVPLFFTQPNAIGNYPVDLYRLKVPDSFFTQRKETQTLYSMMRSREGIVYLGDLFETFGRRRKAIVDDVHYSPSFNEFLAKHVAASIKLETLTPRQSVVDNSAATGLPRSLP